MYQQWLKKATQFSKETTLPSSNSIKKFPNHMKVHVARDTMKAVESMVAKLKIRAHVKVVVMRRIMTVFSGAVTYEITRL